MQLKTFMMSKNMLTKIFIISKKKLTWKVMVDQKVRLGAKVALPTTRPSLSAKRLKLRK